MTSTAATAGTARKAPKIPPTAPPTSRLAITRKDDSLIVLRITIGTRTLPSTNWMTMYAIPTQMISCGSTVAATSSAGITPISGPTSGIASANPAMRPRSSAEGRPSTE